MSDTLPPFLRLDHRTPQTALAAHAAIAATIAGYPLLESVRTCHVQTSPGAAGHGRAPLNVIGHSDHRWTDRNRDIVTPANDPLYSNAWIDLRHGPVLITAPPQTGRFFVLQLLDAHTISPSKAAWRWSGRLGRYGDDLMLRAATAYKGLGALAADIALYLNTDHDHDGQPLHGDHLYRIRYLILRLYHPQQRMLKGQYRFSEMERIA